MRYSIYFLAVTALLLLNCTGTFSQDNNACNVEMENLKGTYTGDCQKGFAHGKGTATGRHRYVGSFKSGLPDGKGTYYYNDSTYFEGSFQEGIREGKGEYHFRKNNNEDSMQKGFWSGDVFRGKNYETYKFDAKNLFDQFDANSSRNGNSVTFNITTTSGSPDGTITGTAGSGYVLTLTSLTVLQGDPITMVSTYSTANTFSATYKIEKFPIILMATLSKGQIFQIELYKKAAWVIKCYVNK